MVICLVFGTLYYILTLNFYLSISYFDKVIWKDKYWELIIQKVHYNIFLIGYIYLLSQLSFMQNYISRNIKSIKSYSILYYTLLYILYYIILSHTFIEEDVNFSEGIIPLHEWWSAGLLSILVGSHSHVYGHVIPLACKMPQNFKKRKIESWTKQSNVPCLLFF